MPSQVLGRTLKSNKGLTELDIESNSITPKACTVLANAISFNETLLVFNINGNILGKTGAQALVAAIQRSSTENRKLQVSFVNCDCVQDDANIFSAANPHGTWRLNLKEPYGQMVAAECLYLANYKAGCRIVKMFHNGALITLERSFSSDGGEESSEAKKSKLEEFYKNCRHAATVLLTGLCLLFVLYFVFAISYYYYVAFRDDGRGIKSAASSAEYLRFQNGRRTTLIST
jgi:hypothetical protein